eukprot:PITA_13130
MLGIDSSIVEQEIKMYPDVKSVRQRLRQVHPKKAVAIKAEVEKILHAGFIYPVPLTDWDQSKTAFICSWGTFAYRKLPFALNNAGETFQRVMNYDFHDIKNIVQPYLDDIPAHSRKRIDHLRHLRLIFLCCRNYKIRLNPHKCVFCVSSGRLLGFMVSKDGIRLDPCKVQEIIDFPPPSNFL